jgi:hypothetical protein
LPGSRALGAEPRHARLAQVPERLRHPDDEVVMRASHLPITVSDQGARQGPAEAATLRRYCAAL